MATPLRQAALRCRCQRCGVGSLRAGLPTVRPACTEYGLDLSAANTGDGAASAVILLLGAVMVGAVFRVGFRFDSPAWMHLMLWSTVALPFVVLPMRPLKAALVVQQCWYRTVGTSL